MKDNQRQRRVESKNLADVVESVLGAVFVEQLSLEAVARQLEVMGVSIISLVIDTWAISDTSMLVDYTLFNTISQAVFKDITFY